MAMALFFSNQYAMYCRLIRRYLELKHSATYSYDDIERKYSSIMLMLSELAFIRNTTQAILRESAREKIYDVMIELYNIK